MNFPIFQLIDHEVDNKKLRKKVITCALCTIILKVYNMNPLIIPKSVVLKTTSDAFFQYLITTGAKNACAYLSLATCYLLMVHYLREISNTPITPFASSIFKDGLIDYHEYLDEAKKFISTNFNAHSFHIHFVLIPLITIYATFISLIVLTSRIALAYVTKLAPYIVAAVAIKVTSNDLAHLLSRLFN